MAIQTGLYQTWLETPKTKFSRVTAHLIAVNIDHEWLTRKHNTEHTGTDMSCIMRKPTFCICQNKGTDADQHLCSPLFLLLEKNNPSSCYIQNHKLLALFCDCTNRFVSDLFRNPLDQFSHVTAHLIAVNIDHEWLIRKHNSVHTGTDMSSIMRKQTFCTCKNKGAVTAKLISTFVFATQIVQIPYLLNQNFLVSSHLLCLYSLFCVRYVRKPHCWFSHDMAHVIY